MQNYYKPMVSGLPWSTLLDLFGWEFIFRGWLLFGYTRKFGTDGIWLQAVPFALAHIGKPELETLSTIFGGFVFGWVAWRTKIIRLSVVDPLVCCHIYDNCRGRCTWLISSFALPSRRIFRDPRSLSMQSRLTQWAWIGDDSWWQHRRKAFLLGCGQIKPHSDGSKEIASIAVKEEERGKGIARLIISTLIKLEPERPLYLMCRARLNSFYDKFGFRAIILEEMPTYFKRISRAERIFNFASRAEDRLLVMRLD